MEKNFLSLIKTCRSVWTYKSESVPSKALDAVLEAGTYPAQEAGHDHPNRELTPEEQMLLETSYDGFVLVVNGHVLPLGGHPPVQFIQYDIG